MAGLIVRNKNSRTTKLNKKCWKKEGCPFNSNTSYKYMKCWRENYSVEQCMKDNIGLFKSPNQRVIQYENNNDGQLSEERYER